MASPPERLISARPASPPSITLHSPENQISKPSTTQSAPRRSANLHQTLLTKLRPLPFQYIYTFYHQKSSTSSGPTSLTLLSDSIPDIATFYRIYNNFPFASLSLKDSVHLFRSSVTPLWEDASNLTGGCWVLKARREDSRSLKIFEEIAILVVGGELQVAIQGEHDHVLGISYSPRLYWAHISVWTKKGGNEKSIQALERTILEGLSEELRPGSKGEYYYKKHSEHDGWEQATSEVRKVEEGKETNTGK
jgi:hypothetical protein